MRTEIACDGSSIGNPGPGGWCCYIDESRWSAGGETHTTNNRMELTAVLEAVRRCDGALTLICDSRYVIDSLTSWRHGWKRRGWRKADGRPVANRDLFEALDEALEGRDVIFVWVRGHDGHRLNENADQRARAAAEAQRDRREMVVGPGISRR